MENRYKCVCIKNNKDYIIGDICLYYNTKSNHYMVECKYDMNYVYVYRKDDYSQCFISLEKSRELKLNKILNG